MIFVRSFVTLSALLLLDTGASAFSVGNLNALGIQNKAFSSSTELAAAPVPKNDSRRSFLAQALMIPATALVATTTATTSSCQPAYAQVYMDPAVYGDQELRGSAVNSLKEAVRRAILQNPELVNSFYDLAILDGLSYDATTKEYGPDGRIVSKVLSSSKEESAYVRNLEKACLVLIQACRDLTKLTSIGIADAVALGGVAAVESIGGPFLSVQLGRTDAPKNSPPSPIDLNLFSGNVPTATVTAAFQRSGLTEREMTAILGTMLTLDAVQKTRSSADWKASSKPKFVEPGKLGRASDFKPLTERDISDLTDDDDDDMSSVQGDDGWYIAESFGTRDEQFGAKIGDDINEKTFNKYIKDLYMASKKKGSATSFGWMGDILTDKNNPTTQAWLSKYAGSYLNFNKDLAIAYNAVTQLGAEYTGGKYENLLKNKKRKTLNDDDLGLF